MEIDGFIELLLLIVGEIAGDVSFFLLGARKNSDRENKSENAGFGGRRDEAEKERKRQYCLCKVSGILVLFAFIACVGAKEACDYVLKFLADRVPLGAVPAVIDFLRGLLRQFGGLSSMAVFMFLYRKLREGWKKQINLELPVPWEIRDEYGRIFVWDDIKGEYRLSEKWAFVKDCTKYIMLLNFSFLAVLHFNTRFSMPFHSFLEFVPLELVPIAGSVILLEFYNLLSFDDRSPFWWGRGKEESAVMHLDLQMLKCKYEDRNFAGFVAPLELRRNSVQVRDEMLDFMKRCKTDANPFIQYFETYLEQRRWPEGRHYHASCLETAVRLIREENIFCATPFYKDIDVCIFFLIYLSLLRGKKALILVEDCGELEDLAKWVRLGVEEIQGLEDFWRVNILEEFGDETDVGILPFQDIYRSEDFVWLEEYLGEVTFAVVLEASDMLAGGQEAIANLTEKIGRAPDRCTWLLCDKNAESMLDLFSHLLNKKFTYVSATPPRAEESVIAYWDVEKEVRRSWEPVKHYLGVEIQIAEVAWTEAVKPLVWYGEELAPIYDLKWIFGQYCEEFYKRTGHKPQQYVMDEEIAVEIAGNTCKLSDECFLIVEDHYFNLYETGRQYISRGARKAMVHVLSPNYMLRDFMKSNEDSMYVDPKYIAQFVPEYVYTKRNAAVHLIRRMLRQPVSETEISGALEMCEEEAEFSGLETVKGLINLILNLEDAEIKITYQNHFSEKLGELVQERYYEIRSDEVKKSFLRYFQKACYMDEKGEKKHINKLILAGHLDQKYLKGQFATFKGLYYEVMGRTTTDFEYILRVQRASEQISGRRYYRQDRRYQIEILDESVHSLTDYQCQSLCLSRCSANITVHTNGYYASRGWNDIAFAVYVESGGVEERRYRSKQILKVELKGEGENRGELVCLLACLLQESFCTFYPQQYYLLSAALERSRYEGAASEEMLRGVLSDLAVEGKGETQKEESGTEKKASGAENGDCFYIIEDSKEDMGLIRSIERNFQRILDLLSGYMEWSRETGDEYLLFGKRYRDEAEVVGSDGAARLETENRE